MSARAITVHERTGWLMEMLDFLALGALATACDRLLLSLQRRGLVHWRGPDDMTG